MPAILRRVAALGLLVSSPLQAQAPQHPLDGLSGAEHWAARDVLVAAGKVDSTTRVPYVGLHEPPKAEVLAWKPGTAFRREALVHLVTGDMGYEAVVDLVGKKLLRWEPVPGVQHMHTPDEVGAAHGLVMADSAFQAGLRRRGATDPALLNCFPIATTYMGLPEEQGRRIVRVECWYAHGAVTGYGRPLTDLAWWT
jgi:primary-amine oxidase